RPCAAPGTILLDVAEVRRLGDRCDVEDVDERIKAALGAAAAAAPFKGQPVHGEPEVPAQETAAVVDQAVRRLRTRLGAGGNRSEWDVRPAAEGDVAIDVVVAVHGPVAVHRVVL